MTAGFMADLRHAFRLYLKTPWQSALAILMLATAMALVSAMASLWSDLYLSGTPGVADDRGLVTIGLRGDRLGGLFSARSLEEYIAATNTLESVAASSGFASFSDVEFEGEPLTDIGEPVYPGYFEALQPRMHLGRAPAAEELEGDGARVLVLGYDFWQEKLGGDHDVVGREVEMAGERWRVSGIADPDFTGLSHRPPAFWLPWRRFYAELMPDFAEQWLNQFPFWRLAGRTRPGIRAPAVEAEAARFVETFDFQGQSGRAPEAGQVVVMPGLVLNAASHEAARRQVTLLLAASALVAAVAGFNVGIFLLARAPARRRELALRQTLGANRRRLARQLTTEAGLLILTATGAGLILSVWLAALVRDLAFLRRAGFSDQWFNLPALGMTAGLAAVLAVLVALVPITLVRRRQLSQESRQISARPGLFQRGAGLLQLSLAGLVGAAALGFLLHLWLMEHRDRGFKAEGILVASLATRERPGSSFQLPTAEAVYSFRETVRERLGSLPGVRQVAFGLPVPGQGMRMMRTLDIDDQVVEARWIIAGPGFFELLGIPLLKGRGIESDDDVGLVVSRTFAEQAWGELDVVGRFAYGDDGDEPNENGRILGVVEDVHYDHPENQPVPLAFNASGSMRFQAAILLSGDPDPDLVEAAIKDVLDTHLDIMKVGQVTTLSEMVRKLTAADRARALITGLFGLTIVLMAGFGFFAMQRFLVDAGQRETAIRMALGAGPRLIHRHALVQGLKLGLPGLVIGSLLALITAAWLSDDLISADVSVTLVGAGVSITLLLLMLTASLQPAVRAARSRPGELLGEE